MAQLFNMEHIDGLVQDCGISSASAMKILHYYAKLTTYSANMSDLIFFQYF